MARYLDPADGWPGDDPQIRNDLDDPALIRAQLARMNDDQLRRLLVWLDQRGPPPARPSRCIRPTRAIRPRAI